MGEYVIAWRGSDFLILRVVSRRQAQRVQAGLSNVREQHEVGPVESRESEIGPAIPLGERYAGDDWKSGADIARHLAQHGPVVGAPGPYAKGPRRIASDAPSVGRPVSFIGSTGHNLECSADFRRLDVERFDSLRHGGDRPSQARGRERQKLSSLND